MTTQSDGNLTLGNPAIIGPLETLESRFEELEAEMARPDVAADYKRLEGSVTSAGIHRADRPGISPVQEGP